MQNSRIPMLNQNASAQDIINYLTWLENSPYMYHIDESPLDILFDEELEMSEEHLNLLSHNSEIMWGFPCENVSQFLWSHYYNDTRFCPMVNEIKENF